MAGAYLYKMMATGESPDDETSLQSKGRKVWLDGAPTDVLHIEFRDGSRKNLSAIDEQQETHEPLEPADGRYWADLSAPERRSFYWQDITGVRLNLYELSRQLPRPDAIRVWSLQSLYCGRRRYGEKLEGFGGCSSAIR